MNINDLPKNSYNLVQPKPLNIKDLPVDSYQPIQPVEDTSKIGAIPKKKTLVGGIIDEATKKKREASGGFLGTFLPVTATLPQAIGELSGSVAQAKTAKNISEDISRNADTATELLKKIQAEKNPVKKENLRVFLRTVANDVGEKSANLNKMVTGEGIREATKIDLGLVGKIPAMPSTDDPVEVAKTIAGRSIKQIGVAAVPQLGATAAFGAIGAGTALEEGKTPIGVAANTIGYAATGRLLGVIGNKVASAPLAQRIASSPVGSAVLKVSNKIYSPFLATPAEEGTIGAQVDTAFKNFGKIADKLFTPSTYLKPATEAVGVGAEKVGLRGTPEERLQQAQGKIKTYWEDTKSRYQAAVRYDKDSPTVLGREGIIPNGRNGAMHTKDQAELIRMKGASEHSLLNKVLEESRLYGNADEYQAQAIKSLSRNFQGVEKQQAIRAFNEQYSALLKDHASDIVVGANGEKRLPINVINDMKSYMWSQGYPSELAPKSEKVTAEAMRIAGNTAKKYIDVVARAESEEMADVITELNQHSGELFQAEKFLNAMNGKKLPFGQFTRNFSRVVGAVVGSSGGVGGSIVGTMTADKLVSVLQDPNVSVGRAARIVAELNKTNPKVVEDAYRIISNMAVTKASTMALPIGNPSNIPINLPARMPQNIDSLGRPYYEDGVLPTLKEINQNATRSSQMYIQKLPKAK